MKEWFKHWRKGLLQQKKQFLQFLLFYLLLLAYVVCYGAIHEVYDYSWQDNHQGVYYIQNLE